MHPLEKKVKQSIEAHGLIGAGELVLVGVSAGPDSMALLHALHRLSAPGRFTLLAVYVDHGLRPEESAREEVLVGEAAAGLGILWRRGRVPTREHARLHGLSLEHAARDLRYGFFDAVAAERGAGVVAVAHTADDQAEELLLRLLRGTVRGGLSGMAPLSRGKVVRPMLTVSKAEVLAYLEKRGVDFALDSSNHDLRFVRNRVRLQLIPWLKEKFNPGLGELLCHTATVLQDEERYLAEQSDTAYRKALIEDGERPCGQELVTAAGGSGPEKEGGNFEIGLSLEVFLAQPVALRRRMLEKALICMGVVPSGRQLEQLLGASRRGGRGVLGHLAAGVTVSKDERMLRFWRDTPGPRRRRGR